MKVLVCGAGIAGLTLAYCLERHGHTVLIVDRARRLRGDGYMIDFFGSGFDAMERLGLLPELAEIHQPVERFIVLDAKGRLQLSVAYTVIRQRLFRNRHFNFTRGRLEQLLHRKLITSTIQFDTSVESYEEDDGGICVRLTDGTTQMVDLLVGADGVHSRLRRLVFGARDFVTQLGYEAAGFIIESPSPLLDISRALVTVTAPHHQVALYPTGDGRLAAFFLHDVNRSHRDSPDGSLCDGLRRRYQDLQWLVPEVLEECERSPTAYFDTAGQVDLPHWSHGRAVLLGDACQCLSPLAGQGASMAVAGAYVLAELLKGDRGVMAALSVYEQTLKPVIKRQQAAARRMARWLVPTSESRLWLRNALTRASAWPTVAAVVRRRMAAESIFQRGSNGQVTGF